MMVMETNNRNLSILNYRTENELRGDFQYTSIDSPLYDYYFMNLVPIVIYDMQLTVIWSGFHCSIRISMEKSQILYLFHRKQ